MKLEITVNGKSFTAEYNALQGVHGFDSKNDFYRVFVENETAINRAVWRAEESENSSYSYTAKNGSEITAKIFPSN